MIFKNIAGNYNRFDLYYKEKAVIHYGKTKKIYHKSYRRRNEST